MSVFRTMVTSFMLFGAVACTELRESQPARTATEQLLFSVAVERVCDALAMKIPADSKVFLDSSYIEGTDSKYLIATLRDRILRGGGRLVDARDKADLVFEPRVGALSVDRKTTIVGMPSISVPIPLAGTIPIPELALFKRDRQQGVVKLALTGYDAKTGVLQQSSGAKYGFSERTDWVVMFIFGWQDNDLVTKPDNDRWVGQGTFD